MLNGVVTDKYDMPYNICKMWKFSFVKFALCINSIKHANRHLDRTHCRPYWIHEGVVFGHLAYFEIAPVSVMASIRPKYYHDNNSAIWLDFGKIVLPD